MIDIQNLSFTYTKPKKHAVKNISFSIRKGEIFGFLGPSGAGKTTTQRLIIGLLRGYNGKIRVMGRERTAWDKTFYEHIGVAFDFPNLYLKLTAKENLKLISAYYTNQPKSIDALLDSVGLLPDKDQRIEGFSKGMKMRLNFIRSIMHNPDIMFFDEPTSGLDPVNAKIIKDMILAMKAQGKTIFLTTHNMTVAEQLCGRVAFINEGALCAVDSPRSLMIAHGKSSVDVTYKNGDTLASESFALDTIGKSERFAYIVQNKKVLTMHSQEATLEDIFIQFTGRSLI